MDKETQAISSEMGTFAEDARALVSATADVAGEKVAEAREHLAAALERCKEMCGRVRDTAVECTKATHEAVREHPYQAIGIALSVGTLVGYLLTRRGSGNGN